MKLSDQVKKGDVDLSRDEDLSIALMNVISLEEHFYFTAMKTENQKYIGMLNSIRELRKNLMQKIVTDPEGEEWCISKHLLAASMRLIEVGNKQLTKGDNKKAEEMFIKAFDLYSLFWSLNLKLISSDEIIKKEEKEKWTNKLSGVVKKLIDCCKE